MTNISSLIEKLNAQASDYSRIEYGGGTPFGDRLEVQQFRLANGLQVLIVVDNSAPVIAFQAWFRVGSRHETPGKTGLSHLFEHLMFNEVEGLPPGEFDVRMEAMGADNNASTWLDFTQYQESFPKRYLPVVLDLESRRMHQLVLRDPQVESEKEVVKNERRYRVEDDVEGKVEELLWKTAFQKHSYHWPTIGWMDDIESFTTEDCIAFYKTYYAPNNATVVLVGDLDLENALHEITQTYGKLEPSVRPEEATALEPRQTRERVVVTELPTPTEKIVIGYKGPAISHDDHALVGLLVEVLVGGRASRLHRRLVRKDEMASDVGGFLGPHVHPSLIEFSMAARQGHSCEELLTAFEDEINRILSQPITNAELDRARNRTELSLLGSLETADGKASSIGFYETALGRPGAAFEHLDRLTRSSPDELFTVAKKYFRSESRTMVKVHCKQAESENK